MFHGRLRKHLLGAVFLVLIVGLSIGYALYSRSLKINGTSQIKENTWSIYFDNVVKQDGSIAALNEQNEAKIIDTEKTQIKFGINFTKPGEKYEFITDIVNGGTIDAMIDSVQLVGFEDYTDVFSYDVTYLDGTPVKRCDELKAGTRRKVRVIANYAEVDDRKQLPTQTKTVNLTFDVKYIQEDDKTCSINTDTTIRKQLVINPNGGTYNDTAENTSLILEKGEKYTLATPVRSGFVFGGWEVLPAEVYNAENKTITMSDSDVTAVAEWISSAAGTRTIKIDPKGGNYNGTTELTIVSKEVGEEYELLTPNREGFKFNGWKVYPTSVYDEENNKIIVGEYDIDVEAKWIENSSLIYTITINPKGGKYNNTTESTVVEKSLGEEYELLTPTREGYEFAGWTVTPIGSYDEENNKIIVGDSNVSVIANWDRIEVTTYTITVDPKGGKYNNTTEATVVEKAAGEEYELLTPTREGYEFTGWTVTPSSAYDEENKKIVVGTQNVTVEASWNELPSTTRTITIDPNGGVYNGETTATVEIKNEGEEYELLVPTYEGHEFAGWTVTPSSVYDGENNKITVGEENISIVANWTVEQKTKYTITISPNGGTYNESTDNTVLELDEGTVYEMLEPTKENYSFDGWTVDGEGYNEETNKVTLVENITLTAKWVDATPHYNITIDPNGGIYNEEESATIIVKEPGEEYEVLTPTREEYSFTGWTVVPASAYDEGTKKVTITDSNVTLTANWVETNPSYRLIIYPNGGVFNEKTTTTVIPLKNGETYELVDPTREGYAFIGWTSNVDGVLDSDTNIVTMGTSEIELLANWQELPKYYNLIISPNGGTYDGKVTDTVIEVLENTTYSDLLTPTYEGFEFLGWEVFPEGVYDSDTNVISMGETDITLTAKWKDLDEENQIAAGKVARINRTYYDTVQAAFDAANANDVIHVITNVVQNVINNNENAVVLDLEKHSLEGKITNNGSLKIKNGIVRNANDNTIVNNSVLTLINGTYNNTTEECIVNDGTLTMGANDGAVYVNDNLSVSGVTAGLTQNGTFYFYDGYLSGLIGLDGDFDAVPSNYSIYVEHIESTGYQKVYPAMVNDSSVAKVSKSAGKDYYFANLQDAINNAEKWESTVYTIRNFIASYDVKVSRNKTVVIDLTNGNPTFSRDIVNDGNLTLTNGSIVLGNNKIVNNRTLTLERITFSSGSLENYGNATLNNTNVPTLLNHSGEELVCNSTSYTISNITNDAEGFKTTGCSAGTITNSGTYTMNLGSLLKLNNNGLFTMNEVSLRATGVGVTGGTVKVYNSNIGGYTNSSKLTLFDNVSDLFIKDSTLSTTNCYSRDTCYAINGGKLEMENTNITNGSQNAGYSIKNILADSKITGGTITNTAGTAIQSDKNFELNDVTVNSYYGVEAMDIVVNGGNYTGVNCALTVNGNGEINGGTITADYEGMRFGGGIGKELIINDADVSANYYAFSDYGKGLLYIKGGSFISTSTKSNNSALQCTSDCNIVIDTSEENKLLGKRAYFEGEYGIQSWVDTSTITIGDAKIVGNKYYGVRTSNGSIIIGKDDDVIDDSHPEIVGLLYGVYFIGCGEYTCTADYFDGVVKGQTAAFGGVPRQLPDSAVVVYSTETIDDAEYEVSSLVIQEDFLQVGNKTYNSFEKALNDIDTTGTIKVIKNASVGHDFEIDENKNITIDFNDHTLNIYGSIINNGTLTMKDSINNGTVNIITPSKKAVYNKGSLEVVSGYYQTNAYLIYNEANAHIVDGKFEIILDGYSTSHIITNSSTGTVTIDGGEFVITRDPNIQENWNKYYLSGGYDYGIAYGGIIEFNDGVINAHVYSEYKVKLLYSADGTVTMNGGTINLDAVSVKYAGYPIAAIGGKLVTLNDGTINVTGFEGSKIFGLYGYENWRGDFTSGTTNVHGGTINVLGSTDGVGIKGTTADSVIEDVTINTEGICFVADFITVDSGTYNCGIGFDRATTNNATLRPSMTINGGDYTIENIGIMNYNTVTLNDGSMTSNGKLLNNNYTVTVNGGDYEANGEDFAFDFSGNYTQFTMNGGSIISNHGSGINAKTIEIGLFDNEEDGEPDEDDVPVVTAYLNAIDSANVTIGSGKITSLSENGISITGGTTLVIGIDDEDVYDDILVITGKKNGVLINDKTIINFYDGILKGTVNAYDGVIYGLPDGYTIDDDEEDIGDDTYKTTCLTELGDFLKVGRMTYNNFAEAIEDIAGSGTILLLTSAPVNAEVEFPEGKDITLDLNGNSLMLRKSITNNGSLTITTNSENSGISSIIRDPIKNNYSGVLNIVNGTYSAVDRLIYNSGTVNVSNADMSVYNSDIEVDPMVIANYQTNRNYYPTVTVEGSKLTSKYEMDPEEAVYYHTYTYDGKEYGYWTFKSSRYASAIGRDLVDHRSYSVSANISISDSEIEIIDNNPYCGVGDERIDNSYNYSCKVIESSSLNTNNVVINTPTNGVTMGGGTLKDTTINAQRYAIAGTGTLDNTTVTVVDNEAVNGSFDIKDSTITAKNRAITLTGGTVYSGNITSTEGIAIYTNKTISLGTNDGNVNSDDLTIVGDTYGLYIDGGSINFYDGVLKGRTDAYYGTIGVVEAGSNIILGTETIGEEDYHTASIKETGYVILNETQNVKTKSFKTAIETANAGDELKLLDDFQIYEYVEITADKEFTLDLDGHNFAVNYQLSNLGIVTFKDSSEEKGIFSFYKYGIRNYNKMTFNGVKVKRSIGATSNFVFNDGHSNGSTKFELYVVNCDFDNIDTTQSFNGDSDNKITIIGSTVKDITIYDRVDLQIQDSTVDGRVYVYTGYGTGKIKDSVITKDLYFSSINSSYRWDVDNVIIKQALTAYKCQGSINVTNSKMRSVSNSLSVVNISSTEFVVDEDTLTDEEKDNNVTSGEVKIDSYGTLNLTDNVFTSKVTINNQNYNSSTHGILTLEGNTFVHGESRIENTSNEGFVATNNTFTNSRYDSDNWYPFYRSTVGNVTITGDTGSCTHYNGGDVIRITDGTVSISDGNYNNCRIRIDGGSSATLSGNTSSGSLYTVASTNVTSTNDTINNVIYNYGNLTLDNITSNSTVRNYNGGTININSGRIVTTNSYGVRNENGGVVNIGVFDGTGTEESDVSVDNPHIESSSYGIYGKFNYYDGEIYGKYSAYDTNPNDVETNYEPVLYYDLDTGYYYTKLEYIYSGTKYVAVANNVKYTSLPLAINKASGTIKLLDNLNEDVVINNNYPTIDLNGFTITGQITVNSGRSLTLLNGTVINTEGTAIVNNGSLYLGLNDSEVLDDSLSIIGKEYGVESHGTMGFYDGIIYGEEEAVVGDIGYVAKAHTEKKGTGIKNGKTYKTLKLVDALDFVQVGNNTYNSLKAAFDAVPAYQGNMDDVTVVTLIGDGRTDESFTVSGKNVMFDLNGHTLYSSYTISVSGPNFVLTDSSASKKGRIVTTASSYAFNNYSTIRVDGGTYSGVYGFMSGNGQTFINNAKFNYDVSTSNSIYALNVSGNTTVSNSEFVMKNSGDTYMYMYAMYTYGVLNVTNTDITIETSGDNSSYTYGIYYPSQVTLEDVNITINNNNKYGNAYGLYTNSGSNSFSNLKNVEMNISTPNFTSGYNYGIYFYTSTNTVDNVNVEMVNGASQAYGMYFSNSGEHVIKNSTVKVSRDQEYKNSNYAYGIYTSGGMVTVTDTDVTVDNYYSQAYGLYTYAKLTMKDSNVTVNVKDGYAYGLYSSSSTPADIDNVSVDVDIVGPFENYKSYTSYGLYIGGGEIKKSDININDLSTQSYVYGLNGTAKVTDTDIYAKGVYVYGTNGSFEFNGGSIEVESIPHENESYVPTVYAVTTGSYTGVNIKSNKSCVNSYSSVVIADSTMECGTEILYGLSSSTQTYRNVDITATDGFMMSSGTINYLSGSINVQNDAIYFNKNSTSALFNIGQLDENVGATPVITAGRYGVYKGEEPGMVKFYDGVIRAKEDVIIGEFDAYEAEKELVISNEEIDGETYKVTSFE